jgi:hypothetical protein
MLGFFVLLHIYYIMEIQVNKQQLERVVIKWLNKHYGNLTPKKHKGHPNSVFYVNSDNKIMVEYNQEDRDVYVHYDHIWLKIESLFHLDYDDIESFMKVWFEETYKLGGVAPYPTYYLDLIALEEDYKLE